MRAREAFLRGSAAAVVAALWFGSHACAQPRVDSVDAYLRREMTARRIPGLAVAVIQKGRIEKLGAYGDANVEFHVPTTPATLFQIASITKAFTGVAVMMQVEAGRLRLDESVGRYLDSLPPEWRGVTVRQLVNHTSGLPDIVDNPYTVHLVAKTVPEALRVLERRPFEFASGTKWSYNQTNYMLLGMLIEKVTGLTYDQFCLANFLRPLGLTTAAFGDARIIIPNRATGYTMFRFDADHPRRIDQPEALHYEFEPMLYSAAALNISVADLAAWIVALENGKFIRRASLEDIWTPATVGGEPYQRPPGSPFTSYGLGWVLLPRSVHRAVGGSGGLRAAFFVYPEDSLAVVILTNLQGANPESLVEGVANLYFARKR